ncbi:sensor histidine kinase [Paludisphaera mucosa]|uniref:histidine kinase n=1 Tax=Paludisphaera mucosa TaxID=3030827 RepID=A0ABT6F4Y1_9BACT|nr:sensor histidine kinase KdpD [Paludisphaera mucosa]MDG3002643.1 sensor histidine kinase KdpD [Paludisphaera mucosa]
MTDHRPDPDALLERVLSEAAREHRGALKIFFGYAAGVGKTFSMLQAAHRAAAAGREVVVGYIEPHGRPETQALLEGLEALPTRPVPYRGVTLQEFDLDAALARRPGLILVDELAHSNAEGSRHAKRWQDVEELLGAGVDVWTTLNVQHIDSLNDVIGRITGVAVRETVPDRVFDRADDLELVDVSPEELVERLNAGKIYIPDQARRALGSFFQKSNLVALREFSLRQAARRVHTDVESARRQRSVAEPWATSDRLLVCVGPSPTTTRVIRTARRMAAALDAPWVAVSVERAGATDSPAVKDRIAEHFRLAERLGAEVVTLPGEGVASALLDYARTRNVTKILIGKTDQPRWRRLVFGTIVDELLDRSGDVDVYVIRGEGDPPRPAGPPRPAEAIDRVVYLKAGAILAAGGLVAAAFDRFGLREVNVVMALLAAVAIVAARHGRGPAIVASVVAVLGFDFLVVPPRYSLAVTDAQYVITFLVMLAIALLISTLTARLKVQVENGKAREFRLSALYELGRQLSSLSGAVFLSAAAGRKIAELTGGEVVIYLGDPGEPTEIAYGRMTGVALHPVSEPAARWVIEHDRIAGAGTDTLPNAAALFVPLTGSQRTVGAIAVRTEPAARMLEPEQRRSLESCAGQLALALERDRMSIAASEAMIQARAEQVRNALLSSVSHDLRTPLAAIAGASGSLLRGDADDEPTRRQLLETIADEASRLTRLLENILQMSRLELGAAAANKQWNILEEIVGSALGRVRRELRDHQVEVRMPPDLPLVLVDGLLLEQLFLNLLENAARYTPPGSTITITAARDGAWLTISVADDGPGLPPGSEERIFEKFYRASSSSDVGRGSGLGLAICRAVASVHGGTITASNRPAGGVEFLLRLPFPADPPKVELE